MRALLVVSVAVASCSQLIGADDLEYTRGGNAGAGGGAGPAVVPSGACAGERGPEPVNIGGLFCIDSTEVTNAQYLEFLAAPDQPEQSADCAWNVEGGQADYEPNPVISSWPPAELAFDRPVTDVDWCDAKAYCEWAGKRLCGGVDGSNPPDFDGYGSVSTEYYYACSHGGDYAFPYGDTFDSDRCISASRSRAYSIAEFDRCEGPYPGVFNLSGNAAEWLGLCNDVHCRLSPAGFSATGLANSEWSCARATLTDPHLTAPSLGIRCCSDAL